MKHAALILLAAGLSRAQTSSTIAVGNGVQLEITTNFGQPTGEEPLTVEMARASGNSFYRIFRDQNNLAVFAYELVVDLAENGGAVRVTAKPAEDEFAARYPDADGGKPTPTLSSDQTLGPIGSGKDAHIPFFTIPGMGLEVSDTIRVKLNLPAAGSGALRFSDLRVFLNHMRISGPVPPASVSGKFVMFYLPGSGGFFFSAGPVAGRQFVEAGTVDRGRIAFSIDNQDYECIAGAAILTGSDSGEIWVYHDPSYKPAGNWTQDPHSKTPGQAFFTAASDSLSWWLP